MKFFCLSVLALCLPAVVYAAPDPFAEAAAPPQAKASKDPACPCCVHCGCASCPLVSKKLPTGPVSYVQVCDGRKCRWVAVNTSVAASAVSGSPHAAYYHKEETYAESDGRRRLFHRCR